MTMPHLSNCEHSEEGWCLSCVAKLQERYDDLRERVENHVEELAGEPNVEDVMLKCAEAIQIDLVWNDEQTSWETEFQGYKFFHRSDETVDILTPDGILLTNAYLMGVTNSTTQDEIEDGYYKCTIHIGYVDKDVE